MAEIQSIQPLTIPSWVMMDQRFRFKDPGSFRADGETSAETMDGNGRPVRVSFDLQAPLGSSRLCLHCPAEGEPSWWDIVVASHGDAVLFRIEVEFDGNPFVREHTFDYFIYRASSSAPSKLTLLPRSYFTEAEVTEPVAEGLLSMIIGVWTLRVENYDDMEWVPCVQITADELWAMEGYDHDHLPRIVPRFPLVSMDEPSILYFVLCDEEKTWMVTLDMDNKKILRYDDNKAFPSDNIFRGFGFFPSNFSNYLPKHSRLTVLEQEEKKQKQEKEEH